MAYFTLNSLNKQSGLWFLLKSSSVNSLSFFKSDQEEKYLELNIIKLRWEKGTFLGNKLEASQ